MFRQNEKKSRVASATDILISLIESPESKPVPIYDVRQPRVCDNIKAIISEATAWTPFSVIHYTFRLPENDVSAKNFLQIQPDYVNKTIPLGILPAEMRRMVRQSLQWWESAVNLRFIESNQHDPIRIFAFTENKRLDDIVTLGYSGIGTQLLHPSSSHGIGFNCDYFKQKSLAWAIIQETVFHETGHAVSLKHPFTDPCAVTKAGFNTTSFTVMAYDTAINEATGRKTIAITPMPADMDAAQFLYGKNLFTHTGNDVYDFSDYISHDATEFESIATLPWDAGGSDTLSAETIHDDITLDIRPYGQSSHKNGTVKTPNIAIENVIGSHGQNRIYLNHLDNDVDVLHSQQTTLFVDRYHNGKDTVTGFHPDRDKIVLAQLEGRPASWKMKQTSLPACDSPRAMPAQRNATAIEFDSQNSITLLDVNMDQIKPGTISESNDPAVGTRQATTCPIPNEDMTVWKAIGNLPAQLTLDFFSAFACGSALTFLDTLTEDILRHYKCHPDMIHIARKVLHAFYIIYSGTVITNSVGILVTEMLRIFNFSDHQASQAGALVSGTLNLAQNFTPLGITRTFVNVAGGFAGSLFTLWAHNRIQASMADRDQRTDLKEKMTASR